MQQRAVLLVAAHDARTLRNFDAASVTELAVDRAQAPTAVVDGVLTGLPVKRDVTRAVEKDGQTTE